MNFVSAQPEILSAAASRLEEIGTALTDQNTASSAPTTGVVPAAADGVSLVTAARFAVYAQSFQAVSTQAAAIHSAFVSALQTSADSYAVTEAANAASAR